jgi:hypothetical protein
MKQPKYASLFVGNFLKFLKRLLQTIEFNYFKIQQINEQTNKHNP